MKEDIRELTEKMPDNTVIEILYKNYRGVIAWRKVEPHTLYYGNSNWHPDGPRWILFARDVEKNIDRDFLFANILCIGRNNTSQLAAYLLTKRDLTNDERCERTGE